MNLYLISQSVNNNYDTYDSAVVAAKSEDDARSMHPSGCTNLNGKTIWFDTWCSKEDVNVKLIGTAADGVSGIICKSYNAS